MEYGTISMPLSDSAQKQFQDLFEYCRGNGGIPACVREDRAPTYKRLVSNIVFGNLEKAFPIARKRLNHEQWRTLTEKFFSEWSCPSPEFWRMPYALVEYVESTEIAKELKVPWLLDLLLFEWAEIEVIMMPDYQYQVSPVPIKDLWNDRLLINQEHLLLQLSYPVHLQVKHDELDIKGEYFVLCYRHPSSLEAVYMELSAFFLRIFQELLEGNNSTLEAFDLVLKELSVFETSLKSNLRKQTNNFLELLSTNGLLLGKRP